MATSRKYFPHSTFQRMHRTCLCVSCIVACFCISGCWKHFTRDDFIGAYNADFSFATAKLTLRADGTFVQEVWVKSPAKHARSMGTWEYIQSESDRYISFSSGFMDVVTWKDELNPSFDHHQKNYVYDLTVRYQLGQVEIGGDDIPWGRTPRETPYTKQ